MAGTLRLAVLSCLLHLGYAGICVNEELIVVTPRLDRMACAVFFPAILDGLQVFFQQHVEF